MIEIRHKYTGEILHTVDADDLRWANLSGANLSGANLSEANLSRTDLSGANLGRTDLSRTDLSGADLSGADLRWANLSGANLSGANLSEANLSGADLRWAIGDGRIIRSAQFERYHVVICDDWLQIGCKGYRVHEWRGFSDKQITRMDTGALEWWHQHKDAVLAFADCP